VLRTAVIASTLAFAAPAFADDFQEHRVALGLGAPQISLGLFARVYLVGPLFAQVATFSGGSGGEATTTGVLAAGARVHATEKTALLVRGGFACSFIRDTDPTDNHIPEPDGCMHFLAGFAGEAILFWRVATSLGATMGWSPEAPRWLLFPELELSVHI